MTCEDCGEETNRRTRCPNCKLLLCGWCYNHCHMLHLRFKRSDLHELFNKTAAAGKKWLGEDTQQYRPKKKREEPEWYCQHNGHNFVNGVCDRCGDPEVDEVAAVECELCRAIFEHTGRKHCPLHEEALPGLACAVDLPAIEEGQVILPDSGESAPILEEPQHCFPGGLF